MLQAEEMTVGIYIPNFTSLLVGVVEVVVLPLKWKLEVAPRMEKLALFGFAKLQVRLGWPRPAVHP